MSCCEEKSVCDVVDKSGDVSEGCNTYADFSLEGKKVNTAETVIAGGVVAPEKEYVEGLEMREGAENGNCNCNPCTCYPCKC